MGPTSGPSGADRTQVGPMLAPWTLLSGIGRPLLMKLYKGYFTGSMFLCNSNLENLLYTHYLNFSCHLPRRKGLVSTICLSVHPVYHLDRLKNIQNPNRNSRLGSASFIISNPCSVYVPLKRTNSQICKAFKCVDILLAPGNPTLWRGVPVASIQKSFGSSGRDWKPWKKLPIPCKFCTYRFIRYSSTYYGKVRINPLMANTWNPGFFASPVANVAWFVVVRPCYLNRDLLSGPKGN